MQYHNNAKTNIRQRWAIQEAKSTSNRELAKQYCVSHTTIGRWKHKVNCYQKVSQVIADLKRFQKCHNYQRKLKVLQDRIPYEKMIEWYEKKPELFIYHPASMTNFGKNVVKPNN